MVPILLAAGHEVSGYDSDLYDTAPTKW
jgi:hypothetical protein